MATQGHDLVRDLAGVCNRQAAEFSDLLAEAGGDELRFVALAVERGLVSENDAYRVWARRLGVDFDPLDERTLSPQSLHRLPIDVGRRFGAVVVGEADGLLKVALSNPYDVLAIDAIQEATRSPIDVALATPSSIERALARQARGLTGIEKMIAQIAKAEVGADVLSNPEKLKQIAGEDAVVQLVEYVIEEALRTRASDIHLEPQRDEFRVRLRVDGELEVVHRFPKALHAPVCSRIKIVAGLDISERRMPQDGRYVLGGNHPDLELRVSTLPSVFGEKVVMRILDRGAIRLELDRLRMSDGNLSAFKGAFSSPNGLVLLTGPTGSGKTTTLYAAMNAVNEDSINLITVEDPVEYDLPGTVQVQVDTKAGRTFAQVLRAVLRQDPDVIMIGEIRDQETAGIAVQAALTGHLVLSTLHTNTALGAVTRLLDMGVEPYLLGPSLRCVVAQRLVPRICPDCAVPDQPTEEALATFGATDVPEAQRTFRRGAGCPQCRNKGKRGRVPIHEVLVVDTEIGRAISRSMSDQELAAMVERKGRFVSMARDGLLKACQGLVTIEDVAAVTRED